MAIHIPNNFVDSSQQKATFYFALAHVHSWSKTKVSLLHQSVMG